MIRLGFLFVLVVLKLIKLLKSIMVEDMYEGGKNSMFYFKEFNIEHAIIDGKDTYFPSDLH